MKKWKFKPYIHNGKPVKVNTKMPFDFAFKDNISDAKVPPDSSATAPVSPADTGTSGGGPSANLPQKLRVSSGVAQGLKVHDVQPVYPPEARINHIEGEVLLQATIGKDGLIHALKVIKGEPVLAEAARAPSSNGVTGRTC
jgi:outer membrane biosynthesis protein TonB